MAKDAYYFSHDANARNDPKILALIAAYGYEGYGKYWAIIEMLTESADHRLAHKHWFYIGVSSSWLCEPEEVEEFIKNLVNKFELLASDGEYFWSESLLRRMDMRDEKKQQRVNAARKGAQARWGKPQPTQVKTTKSDGERNNDECGSNAIECDSIDVYAKGKERKGKESKVKESKGKETYSGETADIVSYLNSVLGTRYQAGAAKTKALIHARLNEGFTLDDFKSVINKKAGEWTGTDMERYLRPETLFGTKFEGYLNQKITQPKNLNEIDPSTLTGDELENYNNRQAWLEYDDPNMYDWGDAE